MTRAEARAAIQSCYEQVAGAPTTSELDSWIDTEHKLLRRRLSGIAPTMFELVGPTQTTSAGITTLSVAADFERLERLERLYDAEWLPVDVAEDLFPGVGDLAMREQGAAFEVGPVELAPGTYRLVYIPLTATLSADSGAGGTLLVPPGFEDIIVQLCAARARERLEEDSTPNLNRAAATWKEQAPIIKRRYGKHVRPGLRRVRGW